MQLRCGACFQLWKLLDMSVFWKHERPQWHHSTPASVLLVLTLDILSSSLKYDSLLLIVFCSVHQSCLLNKEQKGDKSERLGGATDTVHGMGPLRRSTATDTVHGMGPLRRSTATDTVHGMGPTEEEHCNWHCPWYGAHWGGALQLTLSMVWGPLRRSTATDTVHGMGPTGGGNTATDTVHGMGPTEEEHCNWHCPWYGAHWVSCTGAKSKSNCLVFSW